MNIPPVLISSTRMLVPRIGVYCGCILTHVLTQPSFPELSSGHLPWQTAPQSMSFDVAALVPLCLATPAIEFYHGDDEEAAAMYAAWPHRKMDDYKGEAIRL